MYLVFLFHAKCRAVSCAVNFNNQQFTVYYSRTAHIITVELHILQ